MERPQTPPLRFTTDGALPVSPPTPEVKRRIEENRLKAKALRDQYEAAQRQSNKPAHTVKRTPSGFIADGSDHSPPSGALKRPHSAISKANVPQTIRNARNDDAGGPASKPGRSSDIQVARKFTQYVDWDLSAITDTKGGFLTTEDDPRNKALNAAVEPEGAKRPAGMTERQWEKEQLMRSLRSRKEGPFEPGLSVLRRREKDVAKCRDCGTVEIDWVFETEFKCLVCSGCKEKFPEKYSLLTKTEVKADYLLTDEELKDPDLLPHMEKPNPRASHWHDMMLFLRYQVEDYALSDKKWGSAEGLDAEYARRETEKKKRTEKKFKMKIVELKKKTRTEAYRKALRTGTTGGNFGDVVAGGKHEHEWGIPVENQNGDTVKTCIGCGMEVEELVF